MTPEYSKALDKANLASKVFRTYQLAYRAREIGDKEFLEAKAVHDAACAEYDAAYEKENGLPVAEIIEEIEINDQKEHQCNTKR